VVLLLATRRTKPAFTPFTLIEFVDQLEAGLYHRQDHQLGDALAGLHGEAVVATVPDRDHECLNFSLLAEPLKSLAIKDWDAHRMLSSMLAPYQKHRSEQYAVESIFRFADHASCSSNKTHVLFSGKPAYFRFLKNGEQMIRRLPC
jgi:hypothetical protein